MKIFPHSHFTSVLLALLACSLFGSCGSGSSKTNNPSRRQTKMPTLKPDRTLEAIAYIKRGKAPNKNMKINDLLPPPMRAGLEFNPVKNRKLVDVKISPKINRPQPEPLEFSFSFDTDDRLKILVKEQPEFSGEVSVDKNGTISLPLTGDEINVRKMSVSDLAEAIIKIIYPAFLKNLPEVKVEILASPRLICTVLGAVSSPGPFRVPLGGGEVKTLLSNATSQDATQGAAIFDSKIYERVFVVERALKGYSVRVVNVRRAEAENKPIDVRVGGYVLIAAPTGHWHEDNIYEAARGEWQKYVTTDASSKEQP